MEKEVRRHVLSNVEVTANERVDLTLEEFFILRFAINQEKEEK